MAFRPCSRISRASDGRSVTFCGRASLISMGRLTPVITSTCSLTKVTAEVRRGAAEHVGQHEDIAGSSSVPPAVTTDTRDRRRDFLARLIDILVPADRHRREMRQIADDHLGRVHELGGQLTMRDDNDAEFHANLKPKT